MVISKTGGFGNTLFDYKQVVGNGGELKVACPPNGDFVVINLSDGSLHGSEEYENGVISEKKKLFGRADTSEYKIYFVSYGSISCKGFTPKMSFDVTYEHVSVDVNISYDYELACAVGMGEQFIRFVESHRIQKAAGGAKYHAVLEPYIKNAVREVIGRALRKYPIEDVETDTAELSQQIIDILNSNRTKLYGWGLEVQNFSFNIVDDYVHRQEKKRVEHNRAMRNKK